MMTKSGKNCPNIISPPRDTDHQPEGYPVVTLSVKEYDGLMEDRMTLRKLEAAGVNNWEGLSIDHQPRQNFHAQILSIAS